MASEHATDCRCRNCVLAENERLREAMEPLFVIGELIRTQDNRCTSDPYFLVQEEVRIHGVDFDYATDWTWHNTEDDFCEVTGEDLESIKKLEDSDNLDDVPPRYVQVGYVERWEYVAGFFTEKAADEYIARNKHRHTGELRTYVDSLYHNPEMITVRNLIKSLKRGGGDDE